MKRIIFSVFFLSFIAFAFNSCDSANEAAQAYADFGETLSNVVPAGLKAGAIPSMYFLKDELTGTCSDSYTDCPYVTATGGGDSATGEILMRIWGLDYNDECTAAKLADGTCFTCADCSTGISSNFIIPTLLAAPSTCATTSTTDGNYVNMGVDPCFFDAMIADISNIAECETVSGGAVDLSSAIPWYSSWGIPQTVDFSSYHSRSSGGLWWTVNNGTAGNEQYFLSLDSDWLYAGIKDVDDDFFLFVGTGSPAYYTGLGEYTASEGGTGINISAYAGVLSAITTEFEAFQFRDQGEHNYIERVRSNGNHLWYQSWGSVSETFPETLAAVDTHKDTPYENRCLEIGTSISTSRYVAFSECVTSFSATDVDELNLDSNYTLKIIDAATAGSIDFSTSLTPTITSNSCLEEESSS